MKGKNFWRKKNEKTCLNVMNQCYWFIQTYLSVSLNTFQVLRGA